jgi:hypothetical protein
MRAIASSLASHVELRHRLTSVGSSLWLEGDRVAWSVKVTEEYAAWFTALIKGDLVGDSVSSSGVHQAALGRLAGGLAGCWWAVIRSSVAARSAAVYFQLNGRAVWL